MRILAISDTHTHEPSLQLPDSDVLIHCGDFSKFGVLDMDRFCNWISGLKSELVLLTSGNHEKFIERDPEKFRARVEGSRANVKVLLGEPFEWKGVKFWGDPHQPRFGSWAYNRDRGADIAAQWAQIPDDTDILFTHGPAHGWLDTVDTGEHAGCEELRKRIGQLPKLRLFVSGHIHTGYGRMAVGQLTIANVAICDDNYKPVNQPQEFEL